MRWIIILQIHFFAEKTTDYPSPLALRLFLSLSQGRSGPGVFSYLPVCNTVLVFTLFGSMNVSQAASAVPQT